MPYLNKPKPKPIRKINVEDRQKIYQSAKWQKLRIAKLQQNPLCEICLSKGVINEAIDVHHKDSFLNYDGLERLYKAFDFSNLQSVCKQCHASLHKGGRTSG